MLFRSSRLDAVVDYITSKQSKVGIDIHNGGYAFNELIGGPKLSNEAFADLWARLANHYKHNPNVLFMIMSEPSDQSAYDWVKTANLAIQTIRNIGATQPIVVPGSYFDKALSFAVSDNASKLLKIKDPLNNCLFEVHSYLDTYGSGSNVNEVMSPTIGADRLVGVTKWARKNNKKLFLGEFASGSDPKSLEALENILKYIQQNGDVWSYATWWGCGGRWANYDF